MVRLKTITLAIATTIMICGGFNEVAQGQNNRSDRLQLNQQSAQEDDYLGKILLMAGLASGAGLIGWQLSRYRQSVPSGKVFQPTKQKQKMLLDRVSPRLRRRLLRLINDPKTVNRLLGGIEKNHPHRSPDWMAEKVIYDFQRGR
ncbi:MAG: hypothetical protein AAFQ80_25365 [Cyanobacteria bacterium J06621_8]